MTAPFRPPPPSVELVSQRLATTGLSPTPASNAGSLWSGASSPEKIPPGSIGGDDPTKNLPSLDINTESFAALNKNPVSALMEYAQSRHVEAKIEVISQKGPSHRPVFTLAAYIGNRMFTPITCSNKKDGRKDAADVAIRTLIAEGQYNTDRLMAQVKPSVPLESMTHFDRMAALSHKTFNTLIAAIPETFTGRKVIAAIIMKRSEEDMGLVISVGSGNRCITGQQLSLEGNTVNDSHAEVISRRGFMRFIYRQLEQYEQGKPHEMFESSSSGRLQLKAGISFHMYISTAPCGDGALFSPRDSGTNKAPPNDSCEVEHNPTFTSNAQGLLRTKMEGGEGTIPIEPGFKSQTFDGIQRGERLRTMSCADKICRWNVVGLQGSLLNNLIEPIYMESLTLGYLYDHGHLARAVCCRLAKGEPNINEVLPSGFRLHHPWLGRVTACDPPRETQKTKALSLNWTIGDDRAEVLDGTLGLCYTGVEKTMFSRLTKKCMYDSYKQVCSRMGRFDLLSAPCYRDAKALSQEFKTADGICKQRFKDNGFGIWISKPVEEEMFQ